MRWSEVDVYEIDGGYVAAIFRLAPSGCARVATKVCLAENWARPCERAGPEVVVDAGAETGADGIHTDVPGDEVGWVGGAEGVVVGFLLPELLAGFLFIGETCSLF